MRDIIWVVAASRGAYSDRTEYTICWYTTKAHAEAKAVAMFQKSCEWRRRCADSDNPWDLHTQAAADIGDEQWAYYDETTYVAHELERGK